MTRVQINPALLRWAVERASSKERLQKRFPRLSEWLEGTSQPTLRQLEAFSRATSTPFGFLFLERPPEEQLSVPFFRTLTNEAVQRPSAELILNFLHFGRRERGAMMIAVIRGVFNFVFPRIMRQGWNGAFFGRQSRPLLQRLVRRSRI